MSGESNAARTVRFIQTVASASSADAVAAFFAPDAVMHELPNRIAPHGRKRTVADLQAAFGVGRKLLRSQTYDVRSVIEMGDKWPPKSNGQGSSIRRFRICRPATR